MADTCDCFFGAAKLGDDAFTFGKLASIETPLDMSAATSGFTILLWASRSHIYSRYLWSQETAAGEGMALDNPTADDAVLWLDGVALITAADFFTTGQYVHAAVTYSPTTGYVLYKDGVSVGSSATTTFPDFASTAKKLIWGNSEFGAREFYGNEDECAVIFATLGADQVKALYNNQNAPATFWSTAAVEDGPFSTSADVSVAIVDLEDEISASVAALIGVEAGVVDDPDSVMAIVSTELDVVAMITDEPDVVAAVATVEIDVSVGVIDAPDEISALVELGLEPLYLSLGIVDEEDEVSAIVADRAHLIGRIAISAHPQGRVNARIRPQGESTISARPRARAEISARPAGG